MRTEGEREVGFKGLKDGKGMKEEEAEGERGSE